MLRVGNTDCNEKMSKTLHRFEIANEESAILIFNGFHIANYTDEPRDRSECMHEPDEFTAI